MGKDEFRRFGLAIYSLVFTFAIAIGLIGVFILKTGPLYDISLNLTAGFLQVAIIFFLVQKLFEYDPHYQKRKELEKQLQKVVEVLEGVIDGFRYTDVTYTTREAFQELTNAYETSETSIDIIAWSNIQAQMKQEEARRYVEVTVNRLKRLPSVALRMIFWREEHLEEAERIIALDSAFSEVEIAYFMPPIEDDYPIIIPCVIVDNKNVYFGWGYLGRPRMDTVSITLKQGNAVDSFSSYFAYLWQQGVILKRRGETNLDSAKVAHIRELLKNRKDSTVQWSQEESYRELETAYKASGRSIDIISWKELKVPPSDARKKKYFEILEKQVKDFPHILYRRILWRQEHLEILEERIEDYNKISNLEIVFAIPLKDKETPIMPCVIIDNKIVNFGMGYLGRLGMDEVNITLRQPKAVEAFTHYFAYLWQNGQLLKKRNQEVDRGKLAEITLL